MSPLSPCQQSPSPSSNQCQPKFVFEQVDSPSPSYGGHCSEPRSPPQKLRILLENGHHFAKTRVIQQPVESSVQYDPPSMRKLSEGNMEEQNDSMDTNGNLPIPLKQENAKVKREVVVNPTIIEFQKKLRNHRTQLGLTQQETAQSIQKLTGRKISQTLISRFETNQLHPKNTVSLIPDLERWMRKSSLINTRNLLL